MKNLFATASLLLVFAATSLVAQTTTAPVEGATYVGAFQMDLAIMSAPQPNLTYATEEPDRTVVETTLWLVSGTNGNPDRVLVTTQDADKIMDWAANDPVYHTASQDYVFKKVGANMVWMADALGFDLNAEMTQVFIDKTDEAGTIESRTKLAYGILYNGGNTEVYLLKDGKS